MAHRTGRMISIWKQRSDDCLTGIGPPALYILYTVRLNDANSASHLEGATAFRRLRRENSTWKTRSHYDSRNYRSTKVQLLPEEGHQSTTVRLFALTAPQGARMTAEMIQPGAMVSDGYWSSSLGGVRNQSVAICAVEPW